MLGNLTGFHFLILAGVVVLIFGASKLPIFAKSLGQSAKILRHEIKSIDDEPARTSATAEPERVTVPAAHTAEPQ